jgi:hypothetical protein
MIPTIPRSFPFSAILVAQTEKHSIQISPNPRSASETPLNLYPPLRSLTLEIKMKYPVPLSPIVWINEMIHKMLCLMTPLAGNIHHFFSSFDPVVSATLIFKQQQWPVVQTVSTQDSGNVDRHRSCICIRRILPSNRTKLS